MAPRDPQRALPDGLNCTVCNEPVPADRIRLLARREDLTFIQVECRRCGSTALEFVAAHRDDRAAEPEPISSDDVIAMHEFLAGWQGDARTLVSPTSGTHGPTEGGPRP